LISSEMRTSLGSFTLLLYAAGHEAGREALIELCH
jgi:hypothetical protein